MAFETNHKKHQASQKTFGGARPGSRNASEKAGIFVQDAA
jgi:hypothetical protein